MEMPALRSRRTRVSPSAPGRPTSITASANSSASIAARAASALDTRCTEYFAADEPARDRVGDDVVILDD